MKEKTMSKKPLSSEDKLTNIMNAMADSVVETSDIDILSGAKEKSPDISLRAKNIRGILQKAVVAEKQNLPEIVTNAIKENVVIENKTTDNVVFEAKLSTNKTSDEKEGKTEINFSLIYKTNSVKGEKSKRIFSFWKHLLEKIFSVNLAIFPRIAFVASFVIICLISIGLVYFLLKNQSSNTAEINKPISKSSATQQIRATPSPLTNKENKPDVLVTQPNDVNTPDLPNGFDNHNSNSRNKKDKNYKTIPNLPKNDSPDLNDLQAYLIEPSQNERGVSKEFDFAKVKTVYIEDFGSDVYNKELETELKKQISQLWEIVETNGADVIFRLNENSNQLILVNQENKELLCISNLNPYKYKTNDVVNQVMKKLGILSRNNSKNK